MGGWGRGGEMGFREKETKIVRLSGKHPVKGARIRVKVRVG